jgi:hypothetical protein
MEQKIIWMRYLIIGISIIVFPFFILSCNDTEVEYILETDFIYKNLTSETVELNLYNEQNDNYKNYSILSGEEIKIHSEVSGPRTGIGEPFFEASKIIIRFLSSNLCIENYPKLKDVKQYDNFTESMYNSSNNILIYNIDDDEYSQAENCN